jgi:hypothetical protein
MAAKSLKGERMRLWGLSATAGVLRVMPCSLGRARRRLVGAQGLDGREHEVHGAAYVGVAQ